MTHQNSDLIKYVSVKRGSWRWNVREDRREIVDSPVFARFDELLRAGRIKATTVSARKTTAIAPASVAQTDVDLVVKNYRFGHWYQKARSWFRRMVGIKELRLGLEMLRRGIPASVPVAVGERRAAGMVVQSFVAVECLPGVVDFEIFAINVNPADLDAKALRARRRAVRGLGARVRKLHDEGIYQYDCNPCNFLINPETLEQTFIDLAKVSVYRNMPQEKKLENLAKIARRRERVPLTDAMRFLRGYAGEGRDAREERFELFRRAEEKNRAIVRDDVEQEGARCLRNGRNFAVVRDGDRSGVLNKTCNKLGRYDKILLADYFEKAEKACAAGTPAAINCFGREVRADVRCGDYPEMEAAWRRLNMLLRAGLGCDLPVALLKSGGRGFLLAEKDAVRPDERAARAMAFLGLGRCGK